jgi:hypothetical protein
MQRERRSYIIDGMNNPESLPRSSSSSNFELGTARQKGVARLAYDLWQRYGCPAGRDEMIWLEAERLVARGGGGKAASTRKAPVEADEKSLRDLDLISLPGDAAGRGPTSLP